MDITEKELKDALNILDRPVKINSKVYKYFDEENYEKLRQTYLKCLEIHNKLDSIIGLAKEHKILKQFIIDKGLYEELLNDDKFIEWMKEDK